MYRSVRCFFFTLTFAWSIALPTPGGDLQPLETLDNSAPSNGSGVVSPRTVVTTSFGTSYQVNVNSAGQNIVGDAANEPSLCLDPTHPNRIAIGWRQFNNVTNNFRQAGYSFSTNAGVTWTFGGVLETNVFRSDPVLASDPDGRFYYLSLLQNPLRCDLWRSTNGGASWQRQGPAVGGDKQWMTIDNSSSAGRGAVYQAWSDAQNVFSNRNFSQSRDGGLTWSNPVVIPQMPFWNTLDVGPRGELYILGWNGSGFWFTRALNATNGNAAIAFDLSTKVNLGGSIVSGGSVNPEGLLGQAWIVVDRSAGATRGNLYALCTVSAGSDPADVMFVRSTNGGSTWSLPLRLNTDALPQNAYHWFGTLSVAPNGRLDACWYDTRSNPNNNFSELYYISSKDAGLTWSTNRAVSPAFDHTLGYPAQEKIGDYIGMISLENSACVAYTATFNGEEDVYFTQLYQPILAAANRSTGGVRISWNAVIGKTYCLQYQDGLSASWASAPSLTCITATNSLMQIELNPAVSPNRFFRIALQSP